MPGVPDAPEAAPNDAREYRPGFLPDGTPLRLTAGILLDLSEFHYQDFTLYVPSSPGEWAQLLYMASRGGEAPGPWHQMRAGGEKPLMSDVHAFRAEVSRWVSEAFRPSEFSQVVPLGVDLWISANKPKALPVEVQKKTSEDPPQTRPLP